MKINTIKKDIHHKINNHLSNLILILIQIIIQKVYIKQKQIQNHLNNNNLLFLNKFKINNKIINNLEKLSSLLKML